MMEDKIIFLYLDHVSHFKGGVVLPGHHGGHTGYHDGVPRRIEWAPCGGILGGVYLQLAAERCSPRYTGSSWSCLGGGLRQSRRWDGPTPHGLPVSLCSLCLALCLAELVPQRLCCATLGRL